MQPESVHNRHQTTKSNGRTMSALNNNTQVTNSRTSTTNTIYSRPGRRKHASFHEFLAGFSLYCACVFLPSLPRYIYLFYQRVESYARSIGERILWYVWVTWRFSLLVMEKLGWIADPFGKRYDDETMGSGSTSKRVRIRSFLRKFLWTSSAGSLWEEFNQQEMKGAGGTASSVSSTAYTWGFGWSGSTSPAITMILCDIQILTMLAVTLAIIRIWFVHMLVPEYLAPRRLEALTRCKSSHLLSSSSYKFDAEARLESAALQQTNGSRMTNKSRGWYDRMVVYASFHWYR